MRDDRWSWTWLALASVLLLVANGRDSIWPAAWLAPLLLLRFVRTQRAAVALPAAYAITAATFAFQFRGMVPIPGGAYYAFLAGMSAVVVLPYATDRWLAPRLGGFAGTLVLPTAWVAMEHSTALGPYGTWGAIGYSQYGNLPLLQLLSVTGLSGLAFLVAWFASTANRLWEEGLGSRAALRQAAVCAGTIAAVMLAGGARLAFFPPSSPTVRVASLTRGEFLDGRGDAALGRIFGGSYSPADVATFRAWAQAIDDDLLARSEREAVAGAQIVFWAEANGAVLKDDEAALLARASALAAKHGIELGLALGTVSPGAARPLENKLVLVRDDGTVAFEYRKARPVPGGEAALSSPGDGRLHAVATARGRLGGAICFDGDFPPLLAQAGTLGTDILLDPASDWRAIDPWHTQMASFRAVEQGFNLVRQTRLGRSAAYDYEGRLLASMDHFHAAERTLVAEVPTRGVRTIYSRAGDWLVWLSLLTLAALALRGVRRGRSAIPG